MNETKKQKLQELSLLPSKDFYDEFQEIWNEISAEMVRDGDAKSLADAAIILHEICDDAGEATTKTNTPKNITIVYLTKAGYRALDLRRFTLRTTEAEATELARKRGERQVYKRPGKFEYFVAVAK